MNETDKQRRERDAQERADELANNSIGSSRRSGPDAPGVPDDAAKRVKSPDQQIPESGTTSRDEASGSEDRRDR